MVELDGALAEFVGARLPADGTGIGSAVGDARAALARSRPRSLDLIVLDVFAGARIPAHLTSVEFVRSAAAVLDRAGSTRPTWPTAAGWPSPGARCAVARSAAPRTALVGGAATCCTGAGSATWCWSPAIATLPVAELARRVAGDPFPARVLAGAELSRFVGGAVAPTDRVAVPSPLPPPGFFGRPAPG